MWTVRWSGLTLLISLTVIRAQIEDDFSDLPGPYCESRNTCCDGRQDECAVPILETLCYCDSFCNATGTGSHNDCCPDYYSFCRGVVRTTTFRPSTRPPPDFPGFILRCDYKGKTHRPNQPFKDNCNTCTCVDAGGRAEIQCEQNTCLVDDKIIYTVNNKPDLGWTATNYSDFYGRTLDEGMTLRLGSLRPYAVSEMLPTIKKNNDPSRLPREFDIERKWSGVGLTKIQDQGWCSSSWAVSSTSVASDRFSIISQGMERVQLSTQNLLSCFKGRKIHETCKAGRVDQAWQFMKKFGVVDEPCFPYLGKEKTCTIKMRGDLRRANCAAPSSGRTQRYKVGPAYKLRNETDIMFDIMKSGPVQATMKVHHDFFSYRSGIYQLSDLSLYDDQKYVNEMHSVKIVGWGEENTINGVKKYWKVANSWGRHWGENGYFRIARGVNECEIETYVVGVWPEIEEHIELNSRYFSENRI
ncbi:unnamed protein product [Brassicogethes aeneus]|uniref:SMB domain-containing protein n=1 Tax=Brassicogethes aeneus TaxID=1431903 RepID=A0A9P0AX81_BRAAE|nr:unnamed protein product [Brassicogethes aeneus]